MRVVIIAAFAAALAAPGPGSSAEPDEPSPRISVRTDRPSYHFGEPVWFYVTVGNPGPAALSVENPRCSRTRTRIEISDASGRRYPMSGPASCATTVFETIPPGDEMLYAFELLEYYGTDGGHEYPFGILPPGEYQVRYRSHTSVSEPARFTVAPLDDIDTMPFHDYMRLLGETSGAGLKHAAERYREFARRHPESPFAAALLCRAGVVADLFFDSRHAAEDFRLLIELYPDSGFTSVAVHHLAAGMSRDREDGLAYLRELPEALPGTFAAIMAERVLHRLEMAPSGG